MSCSSMTCFWFIWERGIINLSGESPHGFHAFEEVTSTREWNYKKSILNESDSSESNILSVGVNQKLVHDFLYNSTRATPNVYHARRTKMSTEYSIGETRVSTDELQIEIDMTLELSGEVTIFEAKNGLPDNFAVYQLFLPFLHYKRLASEEGLGIRDVNCCYFLRKKDSDSSLIRLYLYTFPKNDMSSITLLKAKQYHLISA